jgi:hypothetical protein
MSIPHFETFVGEGAGQIQHHLVRLNLAVSLSPHVAETD